MEQPTMVFQYPGTMHVCNVTKDGFNYKIIEAADVNQALEDGWFTSTKEAKAAAEDAAEDADLSAPVTRAELEAKAVELGIEFDEETEDEMLQFEIEEALKQSDSFM